MRGAKKLAIGLVALLVLMGGAIYYSTQVWGSDSGLLLSGTIEASEVRLSTQAGGEVRAVYAGEGDTVQAGQELLRLYAQADRKGETVRSPLNGILIERLVEAHETAAPGSVVAVVADPEDLTVTLYAPETRMGRMELGESVDVTVDAYPGEVFTGRVTYIADTAEFTPRNVQTKDSRQSTVYAVKVAVDQVGRKLKAGMPADVHFAAGMR